MKLRSCLYFLSLVLMVSCANGNQGELKVLQGKIDSLGASHALAIDSMNQKATDQQTIIKRLNEEIKLLADSLDWLKTGSKGTLKNSGPVEDHPRGEPWRPGDKIPDFRKE